MQKYDPAGLKNAATAACGYTFGGSNGALTLLNGGKPSC
jgi:hypothetical protein